MHSLKMTGKEIGKIEQRLLRLTLEERKNVPGFESSRADIIIPGIVIVLSVMEHLSVRRVTISDRGILFGMTEQSQLFY